jgi:hypothetical protein
MTEEDKKRAILQVWLAWKELHTLKDAIERLGHAAHEAGATTTQHQLEVIHHNIARINRELMDAIAQINNAQETDK